ncbi:MAG: DSBA oxidoreductase [Methylibium sp. NZG]|nr:MAG: DSBA oxidoreductase [Methylibium sp. NZG]
MGNAATSKAVEFFFDVGSPATYLAWTQLPALCGAAGARLVYRPMLLGAVFQATGNASPVAVPAKGVYMLRDLARCARRFGVPLRHNPHFPINTLTLMRAITGVQLRMPDRFDALLRAVFTATWLDERNLNDAAVAGQMLAAAGFDPAQIVALAGDADVKAALRTTTEEAIARGVFGAPTMFVGDEMFFGQDRLDFVREALAARAPT